MPEIIPRWEWRTFGRRFSAAEAILAAESSTGVQDSDEVYFLSGAGDIVKVRYDLMDIKVLREVGDDGLERWEPVMKAGFPLPAAEVRRVFEALRLDVPALDAEAYTQAAFTAAFAGPGGAMRAVGVHKRRVRYQLGGCMLELSDVTVDGLPTRTIAIESEDRDAVVETVRALGLDGHVNTNYPRGLAALIDGEPERYAVIDAGTNSIKFHLAERAAAGAWRILVDRAEITRLGEGIDATGEISDAAVARAAAAIEGMVAEARQHGVRALAAVGTAGLRTARNSDAVRATIRERAGITIEVISGDDEARLAFLAAAAALGLADVPIVVFDTGGGSSQFTFGHGAEVDERFSVNVGAVRFTERFGLAGAVSDEVVAAALAAIAEDFGALDGRPRSEALVGMGGAVTNLTAVMHALQTYDPEIVQGSVLDRTEIDRQIALYAGLDAAARRTIVGLQPKRADVILAGACIVRTILDKLGQDALTVSDRGLRHGVLAERFG